MKIIRKSLILSSILALTGCDAGFKQMGTTEFGVIFRNLPRVIGGGVAKDVISPGQVGIVFPWDSIYRFDTSLQYISWGHASQKTEGHVGDYVYTRAFDGNEVGLSVTVQYRISDKPEDLAKLVHLVSTSNDGVRTLVETIARAEIRTSMNELKTSAFFDRNARYSAIDKAKDMMNSQLNREGIVVEKVLLEEHRFERVLKDGSVDRSYQDKIDETQKLGQDTERELLRIDTIKAQKAQEFNEVQAKVNRQIAEADGYAKQSRFKGDSYLQERSNISKGILATGKAEVDGLKQKIAALAGDGGRAILKLEVARNLAKEKPSFVTLGSNGGGAIDVRRMDTNDLLRQIGVSEGLKEDKKSPPVVNGK
jgi:hypothetical protein